LGAQPLPPCSSVGQRAILTVEEVARARLTQTALVRGRLVIGAQCKEECLSGLFPALAPEQVETAVPSGGPLLILTSQELSARGYPFRESIYDGRFPGHCARRYNEYCCGFGISGQLVLVGGSGTAPPPALAKGSSAPAAGPCSGTHELQGPLPPVGPGLPRCLLTADWRDDLDEMWGFVADWACELPQSDEQR
jgi:hypothetical protein